MNQLNTTTEDVGNFLTGLAATLSTAQKVRRVYDRDLALEFNPLLSFFRIGENKLSQILAYFLNQNERHGQGSTFLDSFLEVAGLAEQTSGYSKVHVRTEQPTHEDRRLDIYLEFDDGRFRIGIENKIWAKDQPRQLSDYNKFLSRKDNNYCLIYLTPYNKDPGEHSISKDDAEALRESGVFKALDHSDGISKLLKRWISDCHADKVRSFLKDLHQHIQHTINGEKFMGQNDMIAEYILGAAQHFDTALVVKSSMDALMQKIFEKLEDQLQVMADRHNWVLVDYGMEYSSQQWKHFTFSVTSPLHSDKPLWLRFEFASVWCRKLIWGILTDGKERPVVAAALRDELGIPDGSNRNWAWWKWDEKPYWDGQSFVDINNGTYVAKVEALLEKNIPLVVQTIDKIHNDIWTTKYNS